MFIAKTVQGDISESPELTWLGLPDNIQGVYLVHPVLGISIGIHHYDSYAFMCEGAMLLQSGRKFNRIAEHLYAIKDGRYIHICLRQTGQITSEVLDTPPDISEQIWKRRE